MKRGIPGLIAYPRSRELERGGVRVRLGRMQFRIAMVYCIAAPVRLLSQEVGDYLWAADAEGGPLNMQDTLQVHIDRANSKLSLLGIRIQADWPGSTAGRYAVDLLESGAVPGCVPGAVRVDTPHMIDSRGRLTTVRALFQHSSKQTSRHARRLAADAARTIAKLERFLAPAADGHSYRDGTGLHEIRP